MILGKLSYLEEFKLRVDSALMSVFEEVGMAVIARKAELSKKVAMYLSGYKEEIEDLQMDPSYRQELIKAADESLLQMMKRLGKMAASLIVGRD